MKNNMLKKPLIYSLLILAVLSTLLYLLAGNPEATLWSSLGVMIRGILRSVQWLIAMLLALIACLAFLFALFFSAVALFDRETAARMYENLKTVLFSRLACCTEQCCSTGTGSPCTCTQETSDEAEETAAAESAEQYEAMNAEINSIQGHLHTTRQILTDKIDQLNIRIDNLEAMTADMAGKEQLDTLSHEVRDAVASLSGIQSAVSVMQSAVDQTANQLGEISSEKILGDLPGRVQTLEHQQAAAEAVEISEPVDIAPLQNDIKAMQAELSEVREKADKALQTATEVSSENSSEKILGDLPGRVQTLEQQQAAAEAVELSEPVDIIPLQNDIKAMQAELSEVREKADKALQTATENSAPPVVQEAREASPESGLTPEQSVAVPEQEQEEVQGEHRIFSYFHDTADKDKLVELVRSALEKNMSYKQALNYIVKEFGPDKGKIISSHPSLSKDYIRQCRKKS